MRLRRYSVTVKDNWTPTREFFTLRGALRFQDKHERATTYKWRHGCWHGVAGRWVKIFGEPKAEG